MRSAHDERRAAEIQATHCRTRSGRRQVCAACGQSWPCTDYSWAVPPEPWTWRDMARVAALIVALGVVVPAATSWLLPAWGWTAALLLMPVAILGVAAIASRRRA